jgi:hypothetical protein
MSQGDTVSMFILLPGDLEGIYNLERALPAVDLSSTFRDMQPEELNITLPKFKIETSLDLKSNLMEVRTFVSVLLKTKCYTVHSLFKMHKAKNIVPIHLSVQISSQSTKWMKFGC